MSELHLKRAAEIIRRIQYVTIATVTPDGHPWNSPVYAAFDKDLNFYWFSDKESVHSTNVRASGEAFLVIYDSTVPEGTGVFGGVYMQVTVCEVNKESEVMAAKAVCDERINKESERDFSLYIGDNPLRGYKATPVKMWLNSIDEDADGNYIKDTRVEVDITNLITLLSTHW